MACWHVITAAKRVHVKYADTLSFSMSLSLSLSMLFFTSLPIPGVFNNWRQGYEMSQQQGTSITLPKPDPPPHGVGWGGWGLD